MSTAPGDHDAAPADDSSPAPPRRPPKRRRTLRAGIDAEQDFTITHSTTGGDRVQQIRT